MVRRASLPGASELFRPTGGQPDQPDEPRKQGRADEAAEPGTRTRPKKDPKPSGADEPKTDKPPVASGRVRHDHKITVYFSEDELLALEDANLELRRHHGIRVDRGRLVRTAVALALHGLDTDGDASALVQQLRE